MNRLSWLMPGRADLLTPSVMLLIAANLMFGIDWGAIFSVFLVLV